MDDQEYLKGEGYLKGKENWLIRLYFYCSNGLTILNEFRNMFLGIFALYILLHLTNLWYLILMTVIGIIILIPTGWYMVHRVSRVREWLGLRFGTYYGIKQFNYTKESYNLLVQILEELKKQNGH